MILDRLTLVALIASWVVVGWACYRAGRAERLDREVDVVRRVAWVRWYEEAPPAARVLPPYDWDKGDGAA